METNFIITKHYYDVTVCVGVGMENAFPNLISHVA